NDGLVSFFSDDTSSLDDDLRAAGGDPNVFNQREQIHLYDVRGLVRGIIRMRIITIGYILLFVIVALLLDRVRGMRRLARVTLAGSALTVVMVVVFGLLSYTSFDSLFITFHEISFHNDFWQLDPRTDHLIQMFPFEFWFDAAIALAEAIVV